MYKDLVWEYSPEEVSLYYKEATKDITEDMQRTAVACRMAFGADGRQWKNFMNRLAGKDTHGVSSEFVDHLRALQKVKSKRAGSDPGRVPRRPKKPVSLE